MGRGMYQRVKEAEIILPNQFEKGRGVNEGKPVLKEGTHTHSHTLVSH